MKLESAICVKQNKITFPWQSSLGNCHRINYERATDGDCMCSVSCSENITCLYEKEDSICTFRH